MKRNIALLFTLVLLVVWGCQKETANAQKQESKPAAGAAEKQPAPQPDKAPPKASEKAPAAQIPATAEAPAAKAATPPEDVAGKPTKKDGPPVVIIETSMGTIKVEIYPEKTPVTAANFLRYVDDKFYDGSIFHRVVKGFVIQGGGFDATFGRRLTREPIENEAALGLPNARGTIAMARTQERNSATSQFYLNLRDNAMLNYSGDNMAGWGYCAFGRVIEGMDVVDKIGAVQTGPPGPFPSDVPDTAVTIVSVRRAE
jgi:peptidyl-prolyl cis-trans isomerase B (cyclophilin B)